MDRRLRIPFPLPNLVRLYFHSLCLSLQIFDLIIKWATKTTCPCSLVWRKSRLDRPPRKPKGNQNTTSDMGLASLSLRKKIQQLNSMPMSYEFRLNSTVCFLAVIKQIHFSFCSIKYFSIHISFFSKTWYSFAFSGTMSYFQWKYWEISWNINRKYRLLICNNLLVNTIKILFNRLQDSHFINFQHLFIISISNLFFTHNSCFLF